MKEALRQRLGLRPENLERLNEVLLNPDSQVVNDLLDVVLKHGTPDEINQRAAHAGRLDNLLAAVQQKNPETLEALKWLQTERDQGAFISLKDYRRKVLGDKMAQQPSRGKFPVTLEISACQYFPWLIAIVRRAIENREILPGRFIRVRWMREQEEDGDLPAFAAAMQIVGASWVEQLETRGSDGANIHLGGEETLIGYYGGVGQPNEYALKWLDEFLYYYTHYGLRQVLNVNDGTVLLAFMLHRLGIPVEFKMSVTLGIDNPYSALWALSTACLFAGGDSETPLVGMNWSNSVNAETIKKADQIRRLLGLEKQVRFEHHVTETWKGLVIQPYLRRDELLHLAETVANLSAKHEGGEPQVEQSRIRPSDINDYYRTKQEILTSGDMETLELNFLDKFDSLNRTAFALTERGLPFVAAGVHHNE